MSVVHLMGLVSQASAAARCVPRRFVEGVRGVGSSGWRYGGHEQGGLRERRRHWRRRGFTVREGWRQRGLAARERLPVTAAWTHSCQHKKAKFHSLLISWDIERLEYQHRAKYLLQTIEKKSWNLNPIPRSSFDYSSWEFTVFSSDFIHLILVSTD